MLGWKPWSKQREISQALANTRRVAIKKCHSSGGTALAARLALWFLYSYRPSLVITTAVVDRQVKELMWREIRTAFRGSRVPLPGRLFDVPKIEIASNHYALGFATDTPNSVPGFHSKHILLIKDEAAGIPDDIQDAFESSCAGGFVRILELSQPLYSSGRFYETFRDGERPGVKLFSIEDTDTPLFTGEGNADDWTGLIDPEFSEDMAKRTGIDSTVYGVRIKARFPPLGQDQLISPEWCDEMAGRSPLDVEPGPRVLAADVAGRGRGQTVIYPRQGNVFFRPLVIYNEDPMAVTGYIVRLADRWGAKAIAVDVNGLGSGVAARLKELAYPVVEVNPGASARNRRDYASWGSELYARVAERLREGELAGYIDSDTRRDLTQVRTEILSNGQMRVDKFGETDHSPDLGDAFVYTEAAVLTLRGHEPAALESERV